LPKSRCGQDSFLNLFISLKASLAGEMQKITDSPSRKGISLSPQQNIRPSIKRIFFSKQRFYPRPGKMFLLPTKRPDQKEEETGERKTSSFEPAWITRP
jgi:hypothetical protein